MSRTPARARISAIEYLGSVVVKNTSPWQITISDAHAEVTDRYGNKIADIEVSNLPITLDSGQTVTIEVPIHLTHAIEQLSAIYPDSSVFTVSGHIHYQISWVQTDADVSFPVTRAQIEEYKIVN